VSLLPVVSDVVEVRLLNTHASVQIVTRKKSKRQCGPSHA
jgi:hypothetical protein